MIVIVTEYNLYGIKLSRFTTSKRKEWKCLGQAVLRANATKGGCELFIVISNE